MERIVTEIEKHIDSVSAVLVLVNAIAPRITMPMDYALSALSALFPKTLANNIAFVSTNSRSLLSWNLSKDDIPKGLKDAPQFFLDNPIALQKRYLRLKNDLTSKQMNMELLKVVQPGEERALDMLVKLFGWLDGLESHPVTEIVSLYETSLNIEAKVVDILDQKDREVDTRAEIERLMIALKQHSAVSFSACLHLGLES